MAEVTPDLLFAAPRSLTGALLFGDTGSTPITVGVTVSGTLPGLTAAVSLAPVVSVELAATLPALTAHLLATPLAEVSVAATLPALSLQAHCTPSARVTATATLPGIIASCDCSYDPRVERPTVAHVAPPWQVASRAVSRGVRAGHAQTGHTPVGVQSRSRSAARAGANVQHKAPATLAAAHIGYTAGHRTGSAARAGARFRSKDAVRLPRTDRRFYHQNAVPASAHLFSDWQERERNRRPILRVEWAGAGWRVSVAWRTDEGTGEDLRLGLESLFRGAIRPPAGRSSLPPVVPPGAPHYLPDPNLLFAAPWPANGHLLFGDDVPIAPGTTIVVPIRGAYIVLNTASLVRASDGAPLAATSINLQIDVDSWIWGWEASIPAAQLPLVEPLIGGEPVELIATINNEAFRVLAERIARERTFGQARLRVSGRGRAAMLAAPHSPIVTRTHATARTMQQLIADALTTNGVTLGWAVDWQAADWLVAAGAWNHTGAYIEHAQRLAEAAGAYVQADPMLDMLHVLPRYPLLPWEWATATPDIELPSAPVTREAIEWADKPAYNAVYVSGTEAGGVLGHVRRAGTAGDCVAPMLTDPLITHADASRARGRAVLADTGRQARVSLDLPILPETGIIKPGKLVRYVDGGTARVGLVRSTSVRAQLPAARQTIDLETHA